MILVTHIFVKRRFYILNQESIDFPSRPQTKEKAWERGYLGPQTRKKQELGQYPAILTSHVINNPYIFRLDRTNLLQGLHWS